jgi:hypothetical protein
VHTHVYKDPQSIPYKRCEIPPSCSRISPEHQSCHTPGEQERRATRSTALALNTPLRLTTPSPPSLPYPRTANSPYHQALSTRLASVRPPTLGSLLPFDPSSLLHRLLPWYFHVTLPSIWVPHRHTHPSHSRQSLTLRHISQITSQPRPSLRNTHPSACVLRRAA